jgi:tRNA threonylcarbamoyladenosine biosynthesis protein TsaB
MSDVGGRRLLIDTATRQSSVGLADGTRLVSASTRQSEHRHGSLLLEQLEDVLAAAGVSRKEIAAIGVGIGPGSFTGLRVGLAAAKTIAYALGCSIVGISSAATLARAAAAGAALRGPTAVLLPAGAHDRYLAMAGADPVLLPARTDPLREIGAATLVAVDLPAAEVGPDAADLGRAALQGLLAAMAQLLDERLAVGGTDDVMRLVPAYVALPRGVAADGQEVTWSPDLR